MQYDTRIPSKTHDRYWLVSINDSYAFSKPKELRRSGKWLIFDEPLVIDYYWKLIMDALKNGKLGHSAKVSTAKVNPNAVNNSKRVICVFTENFDDKGDVERIEQELRRLGIENRLIYKLDKDVGKYVHLNHKLEVNFVSEEIA